MRVKTHHLGALLFLTILTQLAGCSYPRAGGTVHERVIIRSDQEISIVWDIGVFPSLQPLMVGKGTYSKRFSDCYNEFLVKTFANNGYKAVAKRVGKATLEEGKPNASYILVLNNDSAWQDLKSNSGSFLKVHGVLYDGHSRKQLWSVKNFLHLDGDANATPVLHLIRALADDGYLGMKIENVVNYDGIVSELNGPPTKCPM